MNEVDKWACQTLRENRPNWSVLEGDIKLYEFKKHNNLVDIATEGFPCQAFSYAGKTGIALKIGWNEPSLTLTCSPARKQTERCHPEETRPFTVREYARIQTFPDDWKFIGSVSQQYK